MAPHRHSFRHWLIAAVVGAFAPILFAAVTGVRATYTPAYLALLAACSAAIGLLLPRRRERMLEFAGEVALFLGVAQVVTVFVMYEGEVDAQSAVAVPLTMFVIAMLAMVALAGTWLRDVLARRRAS